ncbi:MAG: hypothetical protein ACI4EE_02655, partial [Lachnospiraceae bacterium]
MNIDQIIEKRSYEQCKNRKSAQSGVGCQRAGSRTNLTGAGVLVAVIDSGIDYRHPDCMAVFNKTPCYAGGQQLL